MANQELLNYVNQQLVLGTSKDEIKNILLGAGWQENDINDAISQATNLFPESINSEQVKHISGKKLFVFVFIGVLIVGVGALGYFIYNRNKVITSYLPVSPSPTVSVGLPIATSTPTPSQTPVFTPTPPPSQIPTPTKTPNYSAAPKPTPTPTLLPGQITKNGFLLSGSLCTFDFSLAPQSESNARRLLNLCEIDVPKLEAKFGRGPSAPPYKIQFYTPGSGSQGTGADSRAYAGSSGVFLSTDSWRTEFPYDAKILAHEITHVIQSFYGYNTPEYPGWLVEALADYGSYVAGYSNDLESDCYHFSNDMQNQTQVYGCTYKFLKFVGGKYGSEIPFKLHKALQSGTYSDNLWIQYTGKTFNQLTGECSQDSDCGGSYHGGL